MPAGQDLLSTARGRYGAPIAFALGLLPIVLILAGYVVYPLASIFLESLGTDETRSLATYAEFFGPEGSTYRESAWNSILIALASIASCGIVGTGLAFLLTSYEFPGRKLLAAFAIVPMALPSLIGAISFDFLYGESGILPRSLKALFQLQAVPFYLKGMGGVLVVHTFTMYTYFYLPVSAALAGRDDSLEEAARSLGATKAQAFWKVVFPMLTPTLVASSMLVFMMSMASYTAPLIYGIDRTLTMQIYLSRTNGVYDMAAAQSTILSLISVSFLLIMRWYDSRRNYMSVSKGIAQGRTAIRGRLARVLAASGSWLAVLVLILPILVIVLISFSANGSWTVQILPPRYTLKHYMELFSNSRIFVPIRNSLGMSAAATAGNLLFGVAAAYILARKKVPGRQILDSLIMIPWALPGTVVGVSLMSAFNVPTVFSFGQILVGTWWILPLAYFVRHLPLVYRSTHAAFEQCDASTEEAARSLGAPWWYAFRKVVLPMVAGGVASGAILSFVQGIGEFVASILLFTSRNTPISVAIHQRLYAFQFGTACAYGVLQIVVVIVLLFVSEALKGRRRDMVF